MKKYSELVAENATTLASVIPSPEIKDDSYLLKSSELITGYLLTSLKSFYKELDEMRSRLPMNGNLLPYPKDATIQSLTALTFYYGYDGFTELNLFAQRVCRKYRLSRHWDLSIQIAVLTNKFFIPPKEISINLHLPVQGDASFYRNSSFDPAKYPGLYFTKKTSVDALKKWLDSNKYLFDRMQEGLPDSKKKRTELTTILWGYVVWIYLRAGITSWHEISDKLNKAQDNSDWILTSENEVVPSEEELRVYYSRFIKALEQLEKNTSSAV